MENRYTESFAEQPSSASRNAERDFIINAPTRYLSNFVLRLCQKGGEVQTLNQELMRENQQLKANEVVDELGLPNLRALEKHYETLFRKVEYTDQERRFERRPYAAHLFTVGIDMVNFKNFNDTIGYDAGNIALQQTVEALQGELRCGQSSPDFVARMSGDEILVVLGMWDDDKEKAQKIIEERLIDAVKKLNENSESGLLRRALGKNSEEFETIKGLMRKPQRRGVEEYPVGSGPIMLNVGMEGKILDMNGSEIDFKDVYAQCNPKRPDQNNKIFGLAAYPNVQFPLQRRAHETMAATPKE